MKDDDKGSYSQQADWLQYWTTAMQDWQRTYSWALDGFAQRAEQMTGMRGGPALSPDDLMHMGSRMVENWAAAMSAMSSGMGMPSGMAMPAGMGMPGMSMPGGSGRQQIGACTSQAYFATMANLLRWWMRVAQSWAEFARTAAARSGGPLPDGSALGVFADETRAQLRRIAEISLEESAHLQRQMEQLAEQIRNVVDGAAAGADPHRWTRMKD
jgi:hypothetical protein